jgi:hypothetical protein
LARRETLSRAYTALKNNASYSNEQLQKHILNVAFEIGGNILNRMWTPNDEIKNDLIAYENKWFRNNFVIGLQMRAADSEFIDESNDHFKFVKCAIQIERDFSSQSKLTNTSFKWFIATDSDKIRNELKRHFGDKLFMLNGSIGHSSWGNREVFRRAVLDVELLSRCDEIVVTGGSTFGWLAAMKMLKMPFYVNGRSSMEKCLRADLSRPPVNPFDRAVFK